MNKVVDTILPFRATLQTPPDKSISHRALMLGALARGTSILTNVSRAQDVLATRGCLEALGVTFTDRDDATVVNGLSASNFCQPSRPLDCGNSGTTMRLIAGIIAGSSLRVTLIGDESLMGRPMLRVVKPLMAMGGDILTEHGRPPLVVTGRKLKPLVWRPEVASAQVKSAILLAGLACPGTTRVEELYPTRDHTERMLKAFGAKVEYGSGWAQVEGSSIEPLHFRVPGDVSAAAFFTVLAACIPEAALRIEGVGLNPGRIGFLEVLRAMGASVAWTVTSSLPEPMGTIEVKGGSLQAFNIAGELVPRLIDELPILAVAAVCAKGRSEVRDAGELRVKESDRIATLLAELNKLGAVTEEFADGFAITGGHLRGAVVNSHGDHRLAMALAVAGAVASGRTIVQQAECVHVSYPNFWSEFRRFGRGERE